MSLYFDYKLQNPDPGSINIGVEWHPQHPILATASYSQERGGFVILYDELGKPLQDVNFPQHPVAQVTSLAWHPTKKLLVTGWENGEMRTWTGDKDFVTDASHHDMPITVLQWSGSGGRLVSGDTTGLLVGLKLDSRGQITPVFRHELNDALTHVVFRMDQNQSTTCDISGLARAAVAGDERALDMFSAWRPRTAGQRMSFQPGQADNFCFFVATLSGLLHHFSADGVCSEVLNLEGALVKKLLCHERRDQLVVLTDGLNVGQFQVDASGQLTEVMKVKLSGRSQEAAMVWAGPGLLAITTGDMSVRCWDLESGENYVLEQQRSMASSTSPTEILTSLSYCSQKAILSGGSNLGNIVMWQHSATPGTELESQWVREGGCSVRGAVKQLAWAPSEPLLAVNTITSVFVLKEQQLCAHYSHCMSAVQVSSRQLLVEVLPAPGVTHKCLELATDLQVKGVAVSSEHVALWSVHTLVVYQLVGDSSADDVKTSSKVIGSFLCEVETALLHEQSVIVLERDHLQLRTFQGTVKQTLPFSDTEGSPLGAELCGDFLTVTTTGGVVKMWDLSRREAKLHAHPKVLEEDISDFGEIILARSNCVGTKVSVTVAKSNFVPDTKLFLWDVEADTVQYLDFATGRLGSPEPEDFQMTPSPDVTTSRTPSPSASKAAEHECSGRFVLSHYWDAEEPKLLVCEAKRLPRGKEEKCPEVVLATLFTAPDVGLIIQDVIPLAETYTRLLGVHTPHYLLLKKPTDMGMKLGLVKQLVMRDFEGLETSDKATRDAVLSFSYHLTTGDMDEAFSAIRAVQSEAVWTSLARMCVKTQRLDVAAVCLGHMRHARGAMALRAASSEPEIEARVAALAIQLGLLEEAERLYLSCGRHDLLCRLHQAAGDWDRALQVAETWDRIHLRSTYFSYARHLEAKGDLPAAAVMYERAEAHRSQVPRMLLDDPPALEAYIAKAKDPQLTRWWAQYLESVGRMEEALQHYEAAHDHFSLVRVLCYQDELERAGEIASTSGDAAACYHLARRYEALGRTSEALHFFSRARAYGNAVRICKEQGLDEELWGLALNAGSREQVEAAQHYERRGRTDRAVLLYHRAGMLHKALDLAFRTQQYNSLQLIAVDLNSSSDPVLIQKCADFFVENKQFERAVDLLAVGKQYEKALALCVEHRVPISEDLAEKLTAGRGDSDEQARVRVLERVAESALAQGNYHLATKKFTQAGNKVKAMKALLKSGDTEKIVFFANVSRQRDIYVMAANYLQSLDWQNNPDVLRNIVAFYSKGRAPELLANFYVACAQVEVDEYQNYEKALGALGEAMRCLAKVNAPTDPTRHQRATEILTSRTAAVRKFVEVRRLYERGEHEAAMAHCRQMLEDGIGGEGDADAAVRSGDIYALMVEHHASAGEFKVARQLIEEFRRSAPSAVLAYYFNSGLIDKIARGLGVPASSVAPPASRTSSLMGANKGEGDEDDEEERNGKEGEAEEEDIVEEATQDEEQLPSHEALNGRAYFL